MPLLDMQRSQQEVGRIRAGASVTTSSGKQRPTKLDRFLITSDARSVCDSVAAVFGGTVEAYHPMGKDQRGWQVLIEAEELPVAVPPGQTVVSQWWELWQGGGLTRRCDGVKSTCWSKDDGEQQSGCLCPPDHVERAALGANGRACKPTTTLCVMLPDVPGLGQFRLVSHGVYAAMEIGATAQLMQTAFDHGVVLPAILRLSQREGVRRPGQTVNQFAVPELHLLHSLRQLEELAAAPAGSRMVLPPPPAPRAITAGSSTPPPPASNGHAPEHQSSGDGAMSSQQIADRARAATSKAVVDALGKLATDQGVLDDMVDGGDGVLVAVGELLHERLDAIAGRG